MRVWRVLAGVVVCAAILAAGVLLPWRKVPPEGLPRVKYSDWSGVIRLWMADGWQAGGGSIAPYLIAVARLLEDRHPGVYVHVRTVSKEAIAGIGGDNLPRPDMVLVSPADHPLEKLLKPLDLPSGIRAELLAAAGDTCAPIAMGGYALLVNASADASDNWQEIAAKWAGINKRKRGEYSVFQVPISRAEAARAMLGGWPEGSARNVGECSDITAWQDFTAGRAATLFGNQRNIRLFVERVGSGKGFAFNVKALTPQYIDQWYGLAAVKSGARDEKEREALCAEFIALCLSSDGQGMLSKVGAFSVTEGTTLYESGYFKQLEDALKGKLRVVKINA